MRARLLLAFVLILAGCGGSGRSNWQQVRGDGFTFDAPAAWSVSGAAATSGAVDRVEVIAFRLVHPYERRRRDATARELDADAARLADQLKGSVSSRRWLLVGGLDARAYSIEYHGKTAQITFALDGPREYQLLCRRATGGDDAPCARLLASFKVS